MAIKIVFPDEGLPGVLTRIANATLVLRLFVNDITPDRDTELADFTEASWTGYASVNLNLGDFVSSGFIGHVAFLATDPITFLNTGATPETCYGYYVEGSTSDVMIAARFDPAPRTLIALTGETEVTVVIGDFSQQPD